MALEETVYLSFACLNLPSICAEGIRLALTTVSKGERFYTEIGQTETIADRLSPKFERTIPIIVKLDQDQHLKIIMYRVNADTDVIVEKLSEIEVDLIRLLTSPTAVHLPLPSFSPQATIVVKAEVPESYSRGTTLQFNGSALNPHNGGHKPAPYITLELKPSSEGDGKGKVLLYRSEVVHGCADPKWRPFTLPTRAFPSSSEWILEVTCHNFNNNAEDTPMGSFSTTFYQLLNTHNNHKFMLRHGPKRKEDASIELVHLQSREDIPGFLNLMKSGLQLHFSVAVDFTAHNGGPNQLDSLHYIHPHSTNLYMRALEEITHSVAKFDKMGRVTLLGFGAKVPPSFEVSQCFALNGDLTSPHVKGPLEAIHHYRNNAISLLPYAPTEYSGVIHHIVKLAKASQRTSAGFYFSLIILTNGNIKSGIQDAMDTIVQASELPISIVFVALGNKQRPVECSKLQKLVEPTLKSSSNTPLARETATMVVHREDEGQGELARRVLAAIPREVDLWALANQ